MKTKNLLASIFITGAVVASSLTPAYASTVNLIDIDNAWAKSDIQSLVNAGVVAGNPDGTFRPTDNMTREEFATVLAKSMSLQPDAAASMKFSDVDDWARPYVGALVDHNITSGVSTTEFGANDPISREQLAVFFVRALGETDTAMKYQDLQTSFQDDYSIDTWAKPFVGFSQHIHLISGVQNTDGSYSFNPLDNADRQSVAHLAYQFYANGATYQSRAQQMVQANALMDKAANNLASASSYTTSIDSVVSGTGVDGQVHMTVDAVKDAQQYDPNHISYTMHLKGSITGAGSGQSMDNVPIEMYEQEGMSYVNETTDPSAWRYATREASNMNYAVAYDEQKDHIIAPYLQVQAGQNNTTILTGPLDQEALSSLMSQQGVSYDTSSMTNIQYSAAIDNTTGMFKEIDMSYQVDGTNTLTKISYSNINQVQPISIPQNVIDAANANN